MTPAYTVNAGELRTLVTFQEPSVSKDAGGAQKPAWANVDTNPTVWARWVNAHGQEMLTSEALKARQRATVTVRYRADILATWRLLKSDGTFWQIIAPPDNVRGENRWTELLVERTTGSV